MTPSIQDINAIGQPLQAMPDETQALQAAAQQQAAFNYQQEVEKLKRKRALADALMKREQPEGRMVGKIHVAPRASEHLAAGLEKMLGAWQHSQVGQEADAVEARKQQALSQALGRFNGQNPQQTIGALGDYITAGGNEAIGSMLAKDAMTPEFEEKYDPETGAHYRQSRKTGGIEVLKEGGLSKAKQEEARLRRESQQADHAWRAEQRDLDRQAAAERAAQANDLRRDIAESRVSSTAEKPMPPSIMKMVDEKTTDIRSLNEAIARSDKIIANIESKVLDLGLIDNTVNTGKSYTDSKDPKVLAFSDLKTALEDMRSKVMLLHKGAQTDRDAQNAMNTINDNMYNTSVVKANMERLRDLNKQRVSELEKERDSIYAEYKGRPPAAAPAQAAPTGGSARQKLIDNLITQGASPEEAAAFADSKGLK